jgi:hypothetical protein
MGLHGSLVRQIIICMKGQFELIVQALIGSSIGPCEDSGAIHYGVLWANLSSLASCSLFRTWANLSGFSEATFLAVNQMGPNDSLVWQLIICVKGQFKLIVQTLIGNSIGPCEVLGTIHYRLLWTNSGLSASCSLF